jgi:hypothetical protein
MSTVDDKRAPWETYSQSLDEKLDPKLEEEIKEYSQKRHEKTSEQNKEELARWEEENTSLAKQYQFLSPAEYANEGERVGTVIHSSVFINKLRKELHLECWYREHPHQDKLTLLVREGSKEPEIGCWVAKGFMPEYSIVRFDSHGVPLNEKFRGWRTCLLQLILKGIVSEEKAHEVFNKASGPASERYNSTLFEIRNHYAKAI